jgi:hypothetical protein
MSNSVRQPTTRPLMIMNSTFQTPGRRSDSSSRLLWKRRLPRGLASFLDFANSFRRLSAWNAYMAYIQRMGASVIASEYEWKTVKRVVKADAVPIIVLWPRSPIRFVYELADTGPEIDRAALKDLERLVRWR